MSAEAEVSEAFSKPVEQTAEAAEQVKEVLKEVEGDAGDKEAPIEESSEPKTNGTSNHKDDAEGNKENGDNDKRDRRSDRRRGDRFEGRGRGPRGRGGRGGFSRGGRHNIKSDLTTQEESDDPVEIRRQVTSTSPQPNPTLTYLPGRILLLRLQPPPRRLPPRQSRRQ
jgi:lupus La protein